MAIGLCSAGYVTLFFEYETGTAEVKTAYHSSNWQIDLYRKKERIIMKAKKERNRL